MRTAFILFASLSILCFVNAQNNYRQDFLTALNKIPDIKSCEAAYKFMVCKDSSCNDFDGTKNVLAEAYKELSNLQAANAAAITPGGKVAMTEEEAQKLSEKLDNMTEEERQKWVLENAQSLMPGANVHVNQDMNNQTVMDAVAYVTEQQKQELARLPQDLSQSSRSDSVYQSIEGKYKPQKDALLKKFQTESGTQYNPSSRYPYVAGEWTKTEMKKFDRALTEFQKNILPILSNELNDKLAYLIQLKRELTNKYKTTESKIAATHFMDDAKEPANRNFLLTAHTRVLEKVTDHLKQYEGLLLQYANLYAALMKIEAPKS